ncbi:Oligoribonuclease, mitochondrial [Rhizophlyctis rosea]|uniref:Oligoribonuclease, mitochondrial n=1 Tax=Rhizophlyctis rosea TaxID=64517 RepID=A0AAD5X692_9FUNG|nr:Oligoribonuclease, mitochondrial [Rhizophlyctis rosea]
MTGLDLKQDRIIEIAVIITDGELNVVAEGPDLIIHQPKELMDNMNDWCIQHHGQSGLTAAVLKSTITTQEAEEQVLSFVRRYIPNAREGLLAGNSVHVDKQFLQQEMPGLLSHLHYRIVDVSTVKELARRWHPQAYDDAPPKKNTHRALEDIRESIAELQYYRNSVFAKS